MAEYKRYCPKCESINGICDACRIEAQNAWRKALPLKYRNAQIANFNKTKAVSTVISFADYFLDSKNEARWLFVSGNAGVGKTHLVCAMCNYITEKGQIDNAITNEPFVIMKDQEFMFNIQYAHAGRGKQNVNEVVDEIVQKSKKKLIIIDNLAHGTPRTDIALSVYDYMLDLIYESKGWLVMVSNHELKDMGHYIGDYATDRIAEMAKSHIVHVAGESRR